MFGISGENEIARHYFLFYMSNRQTDLIWECGGKKERL